ncbi:MAG: helix-turn-helix domain-containing protein [Betaproteobacteria bacterium]|nr:helix-turn-helix domain-containing protein [Betaproteobacteria bacterium]
MQTHLTTEALAERLGIKPQTLRANLCRNGHYFGLRPVKMPNRLLLWPADAVERLSTGLHTQPEEELGPEMSPPVHQNESGQGR